MGTTTAEPRAICLDLTRTIRRAGRIATGIDRVELAYLDHLLTLDSPVYGLIGTSVGVLLLDRAGIAAVQASRWPPEQGLSRLFRRLRPDQRQALTLARSHAIERASKRRMGRVVRALPKGTLYLNVGHSHVEHRVMEHLAAAGISRQVLIHDAIPLERPELHRPEDVTSLRTKLTVATAHADRLVFVSDEARRQVAAHVPLACPTTVAPIGVPPVADGARPPWAQAPYALALGRIEPRKNIGLLLSAWEHLPTPRPQLHLCGSAQGLPPLPQGVTHHADLPDSSLGPLLRHASALLFPSLIEGFALPPREAASVGTPVFACDTDAMRGLLGEFPVYLPDGDPYLWAAKIGAALQAGAPRPAPQAQPTWDAHFKTVLNLVP